MLPRNPSTARRSVPRHSSMAGAPAEPSLPRIMDSQAGARRDAPHEELHGPVVSPTALPGSQSSGTRTRGTASRNTDQLAPSKPLFMATTAPVLSFSYLERGHGLCIALRKEGIVLISRLEAVTGLGIRTPISNWFGDQNPSQSWFGDQSPSQ